MPVYEYGCRSCGRRTSVFVRTISDPESPACEHCASTDTARVISRFAVAKSMASVWEDSGPPSAMAGDYYYQDPRNIGRWTEQRLEQLGVDMPSEARDMIDAARDGTMPSPIDEL